MRTRLPIVVAALLLVSAGAKAQTADAQQDTPKQAPASSSVESEFGVVNQIDFGIRGTSFAAQSDQARFQRFQDLHDGATVDLFRYTNNTAQYLLKLQADHVGYRDQRFSAAYNNYGKVKASFEWNQIPLNYSYTTQSLYSSSTPGVLTMSDAVQSGIQNKTLTLPAAVTGAAPFDLQSKRNVADFRLTYSATRDLDFKLAFKNTQRDGAQPYAAGFGFGAPTDELALPIDTRTTELGSSLEWANGRAYAKAAYDGSFFHNNIKTLMWDNPVRITDSTAGPVQGREALWPDTNSNMVSVSGGFSQLPGRSSANAYISVGNLSNNDTLIPFTSNTALGAPALPRTTADLSARVTALNFSFTSRPTNLLWFSARYRQYGFDNRSTPFESAASVSYDTSLAGAIASEQLGYTRHTFDADASFSPVTFLGLRGGYTREEIDRTFRFVEKTTEDTGRVSADLTGLGFVTLRGVYEHSKRAAAAAVDPLEILADGEQPGITQYDIAARNRDRVSAIVLVTPVSMLSFNASVSAGKDNYPANGAAAINGVYEHFGLLNNDNRQYQVGFDLVPVENKVTLGATYGYEKYTALQASRNAGHAATLPPAFFDPNSDWTDNSSDKVHTANVSFELTKVLPKFDLKFGYDYSKADSAYAYGGPWAAAAGVIQLQPVTNELQRGTIDGRYFVTRHVAVGLVYWYDKYSVNDFALGPQAGGLAIPVANPSIMMMGYNYRPYTANTFMGRFTYLW